MNLDPISLDIFSSFNVNLEMNLAPDSNNCLMEARHITASSLSRFLIFGRSTS